jgi:hypothetical protein
VIIVTSAGTTYVSLDGILHIFSYLFYLPVILLTRDIPVIGMLMIPKTLMYVAIQFLAYYGLWPREATTTHTAAASADQPSSFCNIGMGLAKNGFLHQSRAIF